MIEVKQLEGTLLVKVTEPRVDASVAIQFKDRFRSAVEGIAGRVVMDLSAVNFVDSSGLGALVACFKQLGPLRKLELVGLTENPEKVLRLTRMDTVFRIHASYDDLNRTLANVS
jgi:anti-sigma B factor antagonist